VLRDDPSLTSRIGDSVECSRRFVVDRTLTTVRAGFLPKLYTDSHKAQTVVLHSSAAPQESLDRLEQLGIAGWELPEVNGLIDLLAFRERCASEGINGVYFEAGPKMASTLLEQSLVDYAFVYKAPKLLNDSVSQSMGSLRSTESMGEAIQLKNVRHAVLEDDVLFRGSIDYT
jgi:diaminohydroxyphosphoribosylaminopyrimidine deaminase/5-amino-6-(5-phosphoribosylamino)uracil reductase